jgi:hypothetical protein
MFRTGELENADARDCRLLRTRGQRQDSHRAAEKPNQFSSSHAFPEAGQAIYSLR